MKLKICGLLPGDDLSFTATEEVTHVGFVLVPKSRRYVQPDDVAQLTAAVHPSCQKVGVFVDTDARAVSQQAKKAGLDVAQLHGSESPKDCASVRESGLQVWKAVSVGNSQDSVDKVAQQIASYASSVDAILLDAAPPKGTDKTVTGGHGLQFDWSYLTRLEEILQELGVRPDAPPIWVAGGIQPENVDELLRNFIPYGIDVSSGVEVAKRKSLNRIEAMRKAVSRYADSATTR